MTGIAAKANRVLILRAQLTSAEADLRDALDDYIAGEYGRAKEIAADAGVTPQYICDIRRGRRLISAEFARRLQRL